jgi:hypothetical protein
VQYDDINLDKNALLSTNQDALKHKEVIYSNKILRHLHHNGWCDLLWDDVGKTSRE